MKSRVTNPERITKKKQTWNHLKVRFQGISGLFFIGMMSQKSFICYPSFSVCKYR